MTAPPLGNWECDPELRRVVTVSSLDLGVTMGKERLKSQEGLRTPDGAYGAITAHGPPRTAGSITARWGRCRLAVPKSKSCTKATSLEVLDLLWVWFWCPSVCLPCHWLSTSLPISASACGLALAPCVHTYRHVCYICRARALLMFSFMFPFQANPV